MSKPDTRFHENVQEKTRQKTKTPPMFRVFLLNDDFTTMDFVVEVLEQVFHKPPLEAHEIMLQVHKAGRGLVGLYTRDIAETKIAAVHSRAKNNGFPLKCAMEPE